MRVRGTEYTHHTGQRRVCASAHVQGPGGQPYRVDANHCKHSRSYWAQAAPPASGQCTTLVALARLMLRGTVPANKSRVSANVGIAAAQDEAVLPCG